MENDQHWENDQAGVPHVSPLLRDMGSSDLGHPPRLKDDVLKLEIFKMGCPMSRRLCETWESETWATRQMPVAPEMSCTSSPTLSV